MCYCLQDEDGRTYIGYTVDVDRRLRQHNGEIKGGARATKRGSNWVRIFHVVGFPDQHEALRFEWAWKAASRKSKAVKAIDRRIEALITLCNKDKVTSNAVGFSTYEAPLYIFIDDDRYKNCLAGVPLQYAIVVE
jgi:structure-specific endonuclease subunit SLX1